MPTISFATPEELNVYSDALQQRTVEMHEGLEEGLSDEESVEVQHHQLDAIVDEVGGMTHDERLAVAARARRPRIDLVPLPMTDIELDYKAGRLGSVRTHRPVAHGRTPQARRARSTSRAHGPPGRSSQDDDPHPLAPHRRRRRR